MRRFLQLTTFERLRFLGALLVDPSLAAPLKLACALLVLALIVALMPLPFPLSIFTRLRFAAAGLVGLALLVNLVPEPQYERALAAATGESS
jgi:hypothetical protein